MTEKNVQDILSNISNCDTKCNNPECKCVNRIIEDISNAIGSSSIYRWHIYLKKEPLFFLSEPSQVNDFLKNNVPLYISNYFPNIIDKLLKIAQQNNCKVSKKSSTQYIVGNATYIIFKENIKTGSLTQQH